MNEIDKQFQRQPNTQYVLSLSYGKDSLACLEAIRLLGLPLDRIVHAEVWATDEIPADPPSMVEFKEKADKIIKERYGIIVEHAYAIKDNEKLTYEKQFYQKRFLKKLQHEQIYGFPMVRGPWCNSKLKLQAVQAVNKSLLKNPSGEKIKTVQYLGIAADEPERIKRHNKQNIILPLVLVNWTEADCRQWCKDNNLLSPLYITASRGGCWFCYNQRIEQLRLLRKSRPDFWALLLKWDKDSPVTFRPDGHTVHDFDKRFEAEEKGLVPTDKKFKWKQLDNIKEKLCT